MANSSTKRSDFGTENQGSNLTDQATSTVADTLDRTGRYLQDQGLGGMAGDLTNLIRSHPLPAVLLGIGLGFMLARMTTSSRS